MKNLFLILIACISCTILFAQSPNLSVQGVLKNSDGSAVTDGTYTVTFKLYNAETGGTKVWEEIHPSLQVSSGIYNAVLGKITSFNGVGFTEQYHLAVEIGGSELTPRVELTAAPYAMAILGDLTLTSDLNVNNNAHVVLDGGYFWGKSQGIYFGTGSNESYIDEDDGAMKFYTGNDENNDKMKLTSIGDLVLEGGQEFLAAGGSHFPTEEVVKLGTETGFKEAESGSNKFLTFYTNNDFAQSKMSISPSGNIAVSSGNMVLNNGYFWAKNDAIFFGADGSEGQIRADGSGFLEFRTAGNTSTAEARIGNNRLHMINGYLKLSNGNSNFWELSTASDNDLVFYYGSTMKGFINFENGSYVNSSDRRLKKDIVPMTNMLDKISLLKPVKYHWKDNPSEVKSIGFIAQEVNEVFPETVNTFEKEGENYFGLAYDNFGVIAIQGVKELYEKVKALEAENEALKSKNSALEEKLSASTQELSARLKKLEMLLAPTGDNTSK